MLQDWLRRYSPEELLHDAENHDTEGVRRVVGQRDERRHADCEVGADGGMNWDTSPVHRASGNQYGTSMIRKKIDVTNALRMAGTIREKT